MPVLARPAIGGIVLGGLALITPAGPLLRPRRAAVDPAAHGDEHDDRVLACSALKALASAVSLGSGFRGGLFFASLFLGALLGQVFAMA